SFDDLAQENGVIGRGQRVRLMAKIGLELTWGIFLARRAHRDALQGGSFGKGAQEFLIAIEIIQPVNRRHVVARAVARREWRLRTPLFVASFVEEIEFELMRRDGS